MNSYLWALVGFSLACTVAAIVWLGVTHAE